MSDTKLKWLITGGCGFLGTSLIRHLLKTQGQADVRILDNLSVGSRDDLSLVTKFSEAALSDIKDGPNGIELSVGDIREYEDCLAACKGVDIIVHLAANTGVGPSVEDPRADMLSNVVGVFNMLEAARHTGTGRFIFASSGAPIGEVEPPIDETKPARPVSPYGASKLAGEGYCSSYFHSFGIKTVALRFGNVYGPLSIHKNSLVAKFYKLALNDETLEIYGDGSQTRDFIYIDDLVQALMLASKTETGGEVFQIATHKETTVNEITDTIKELMLEKAGKQVTIKHGPHRLGDVMRNYSDISKARKILGYEPVNTLRDGLGKTLDYFLDMPKK